MDLGTTTRAALYLNTTQPSISRRIAEIQSAAGLKLFELHRGRLRPTSEAELLHQTIEKHFIGLASIENVLATMRRSGTRVLRIGSTPTLAVGLLPKVIKRFLERFPDTLINIQTTSTQELLNQLHENLIDVAFSTSDFDEAGFCPALIHESEAVCVLPHGHPLENKDTINLEDLQGHRLLFLSDNDELAIRIKALMRKQDNLQEIAIETSSSVTICALVAAGVGVGIVNPYVAGIFTDQLLFKPFRPKLNTSVRMAIPSRKTPSLLAQHLMDLMQDLQNGL